MGKTLGAFLVYLPCLLLALAAVVVVRADVDPASLSATLFAGLATFVLVSPVGAWVSILLPRHADLGVLTRAGNPHQAAQLILMLALSLSVALGGLVSWLGRATLGSAWGALPAQALFLVLAALIAWPLLEAAAAALVQRREAVLTVASGR